MTPPCRDYALPWVAMLVGPAVGDGACVGVVEAVHLVLAQGAGAARFADRFCEGGAAFGPVGQSGGFLTAGALVVVAGFHVVSFDLHN